MGRLRCTRLRRRARAARHSCRSAWAFWLYYEDVRDAVAQRAGSLALASVAVPPLGAMPPKRRKRAGVQPSDCLCSMRSACRSTDWLISGTVLSHPSSCLSDTANGVYADCSWGA